MSAVLPGEEVFASYHMTECLRHLFVSRDKPCMAVYHSEQQMSVQYRSSGLRCTVLDYVLLFTA